MNRKQNLNLHKKAATLLKLSEIASYLRSDAINASHSNIFSELEDKGSVLSFQACYAYARPKDCQQKLQELFWLFF